MQIKKKAAFLAATAGTLVLLGTGTAAAHSGEKEVATPSTVQTCSANTGDISFTSGDTKAGDVGENSSFGNNTVVISVSCFNTPG
ncbi:hypothetical protein [Streptomyces sp. NPDC005336]|uniref:hypothetical protein n=1 Tax=unclassified Streptomyces TaxID=2593676 RepID=UPI0033B8FE6D